MKLKNKRIQLYLSLLLFSLLIATGSALGAEQPANHQLSRELPGYADVIPGLNQTGLFTNPWLFDGDDTWSDDTEQSWFLAQAEGEKEPEGEEKPISPECQALRADPMADIGDVMRAGCEPTLAQMSRLMDNPLGNVAMWINQVDIWILENDAFPGIEKNKTAYMGILQFPKGISENWNIINRIVYSVVSQPLDDNKIKNIGDFNSIITPPGGFTGAPINVLGGRTTGFGDMYYVGIFSPKEGIQHSGGGTSVWGVGFDLGFPTASSDVLGTGKWTAGPSALYAYLGPKWKIGALWQQYIDYAGDSDRNDVNLTNLQYFVYYSVSDTMSVGAGPNIIADWEQDDSNNRFTVPIGLGVNKTINIGKLPIRLGVEVHYSVIYPDSIPGARWDFRFYAIPAVPAALIPFLN